jgi:hypothetical protein
MLLGRVFSGTVLTSAWTNAYIFDYRLVVDGCILSLSGGFLMTLVVCRHSMPSPLCGDYEIHAHRRF